MLYPSNIEKKLDVDKISVLLASYCQSTLGEGFVERLHFSSDKRQVTTWLSQTSEFKSILQSGVSFPHNHYFDVSDSLKRAKVIGAFLLEEEFLKIKNSLDTILSCVSFLKNEEEYPELSQLIYLVNIDNQLISEIVEIIDEKGVVRDHASAALKNIRSEMRKGHQQLRKTLDSIFRSSKDKGYVPEGSSLTVRDGRMVIPLFAEHKRKLKGFIHGESTTGQTIFMEPTEVLEANNQLRELEYAERREVVKLLTKLTDKVRDQVEPLKKAYRFLGIIDFIRAKAKLAQLLEAEMPEIVDTPMISWENARHPLLFLSHKEQNKSVVPLNIRLDPENHLLLISGPNAGGKSVCLKTVGILQYMAQCGMLVPVQENSTLGLFESIFIDIGDEQSIENDLSTYSSHLTNMKHTLKNASARSLVLIDEFGTGTEPNFGGAIAEAILSSMVNKKVCGVITTHYSNLKEFADKTSGLQNGAMRFDIQNLTPLYILEIGKPGSSFALEIARKIGLSHEVIEHAKSLAGREHTDMDKLLRDLERDKSRVLKREKSLKENERKLKQQLSKYEQLSEEIGGKKKEIINKAKVEAERLLSDTNRQIEKTIRHIKENKAEKKETKRVREGLNQLKSKVKPEQREKKPSSIEVIKGEIEVGDFVRLVEQDVVGEVTARKGKDVEVLIGQLKSNMKLNRLERISKREAKTTLRKPKYDNKNSVDLNRKMSEFSSTLDVRGKRAEEVLPLLQNFIDEAAMFNQNEVRVLHGKGHGILRDLVRDRLKGEPNIASFADEHVERGGAGITVVVLK
ncbi:MAG: endonuclease MutS2 [Cyclobacteriaceae bacterium]|nr:endonuclease MutS2 [Cyclobacteriaceae bacterium]